MAFMPGFDSYPSECDIIGRLVVGYGELEFSLAWCVSQIIDDPDSTFKAIFRVRGESNRIDIADALGIGHVPAGTERGMFERAIGGMRFCLKVRNQYAHSNWINSGSGLLFVNIEEIVKKPAQIDLGNLTQYQAELSILRQQRRYFEHVDACLSYLNFEAQKRSGKLKKNHYACPKALKTPPLHSAPIQPYSLQTPRKSLNASRLGSRQGL